MRPLRVFVISLLLPAGTLCISSHSPLDLFAYPAYSVKLNPASPISNSTAEAILAGNKEVESDRTGSENGASPEEMRNDGLQIQAEQRKKLDILGLHDDHGQSGGSQHDQQLKGPSKAYLMRASNNGQAYLCTVPQASTPSTAAPSKAADIANRRAETTKHEQSHAPPNTDAERQEKRTKNDLDKKEAFERGLALLEPLKGSCLYLTQGWFTYAFCYGSEIRQFHAVKNTSPTGPPLIEDLTQDAYTLGLWSNRLTQDEGLVNVKKARALGSLREILASEDKSEENSLELAHGVGKPGTKNDDDTIGDEKRYLVQRWTGGTLCDKTGVDRSIEVQFHCNSQASDKIFLVRETAICEYVMVIHTPRLCGEPIFVGGSSSAAEDAAEKKRKETNVIECRPVVRDELYLQYVHAGKVEQGSGLSRGLPAVESSNGQPMQQATDSQLEQPKSEAAGSRAHGTVDAPAHDEASASKAKAQQVKDAADMASKGLDTAQVEEFVLGSYILAYDRNTGEMTVNPDPEDVIKDDLEMNKGQQDPERPDLSQKEAETMQALLVEFRRSLEEMMRSVGGDLRGAGDETVDVYDTIKRVQDAYEAAATGVPDSVAKDSQAATGGGKDSQSAKQQKGDAHARFMRTGAHNHREIVERYLKGQVGGLIPGKKRNTPVAGEAAQLHRQREPVQHKIGTPQFRNMKKAFEQKWDDEDEANSAKGGKPGGDDQAGKVGASNADARGRDEL